MVGVVAQTAACRRQTGGSISSGCQSTTTRLKSTEGKVAVISGSVGIQGELWNFPKAVVNDPGRQRTLGKTDDITDARQIRDGLRLNRQEDSTKWTASWFTQVATLAVVVYGQNQIPLSQPSTMLILTILSRRGPTHGYGIANAIQEISKEALRVDEGSLYPALHRMEEAGWITAEWLMTENKRRARIYRISRAGAKQLTTERENWNSFSGGVARVLRYA